MHTNTCSLEGNFGKLELLLHNLDWLFVIALNEAWHVRETKPLIQGIWRIIKSVKVCLDYQKGEDVDSILTRPLLT